MTDCPASLPARRPARPNATPAWLKLLVLFAVLAGFTAALPGCGGCTKSPTTTSAKKKKEDEEEKKKKKKKKLEKPKPNFEPIQVRIQYNIQPLTPLFRLVRFGNQGVMPVNIAARRSIEALGNGPITSQNPNGIVCK